VGGSLDCNTFGWKATTDGETHKEGTLQRRDRKDRFLSCISISENGSPHLYRFLALGVLASVPLNPCYVGHQS
jgi:hypothetical protein